MYYKSFKFSRPKSPTLVTVKSQNKQPGDKNLFIFKNQFQNPVAPCILSPKWGHKSI